MRNTPLNSSNGFKAVEERRQTLNNDRRNDERSGKLDRRKNKCSHCTAFNTEAHYCATHQEAIAPDSFACVEFSAR